ncbi:MAG: heparinase II/III family protein [Clostridia bacterium]|nr:heparinase II/III family protein [Clostridia bacterium]
MEIYSQSDIKRIKERVRKAPAFLEAIDAKTANVRRKLYIQKTGLGTWNHYFSCPQCGAALLFDYDCNERFVCSNCGSVHTGEPYLGAWWCKVLVMTTNAAYQLALAYVGSEQKAYFETARQILLGYADNYKNYEVHGGIPYNNPGRFLSQVLSDCDPICSLSRAYALIKNELTADEIEHIEADLLRPAAEHQIKYLTPQLHNHEVAICTSIAAIGLAINDERLVEFACNSKYGLKYQIDHAYLEDGFWFEGSGWYHRYSLSWFMLFEQMAKNTKYSLFKDPHYRKKLESALLFLKNLYVGNHKIAAFNDGGNPLLGMSGICEYAYAALLSEELLPLLAATYGDAARESSLEALLYGVDSLPEKLPPLEKKNYISSRGSNLAKLHGTDDRYLIFKALPYGGEHDHYDRLSISFDAFDAGLCVDFGTSSGYGSPLHYGYYKNTASHNTVVIDGENMAPCETVVNEYRVNAPDDIYLDAETLPPEAYTMPDTFTIKQWSDEAYRGVRMRRIISWHDTYFIDVFSVKSENELKKEWTLHVAAKAQLPSDAEYIGKLSDKGAQSYVDHAYILKPTGGVLKSEFKKGELSLDVYTLTRNCDMIYAQAPDNPADKRVSYLLERTNEKCPVYVNVIEAHKAGGVISSVEATVENGTVCVTVTEHSGRTRSLKVNI